MDPKNATSDASPHSCTYCSIPLATPRTSPRLVQRLRFRQTVREAQYAASQSCPVFEELLDEYRRRSVLTLLKMHLGFQCSCCENLCQRLQHLYFSVGRRPFQLTLQALPHGPGSDDPLHSFAYLESGCANNTKRLNAYTYRGNRAAQIVPSFDRSVFDKHTVTALCDWLASCTCKLYEMGAVRPSFQPKRLIDIDSSLEFGDVMVKDSAKIADVRYVCLSYCWGGNQDMVLKSHDLDDAGCWLVPKKLVPAAFDDAFKVSRSLGYRYIWIDSLCIIQDDAEDLEREILQMPHIYIGADLTICASSSSACGEGFLHTRPAYSEKKLFLSLPGGGEGQIHLDSFRWWKPPVAEPLSTRAWAYQERLLSPRLLEFGWRTSRWTCACTTSYSGYSRLAVEEQSNTSQHGPLQRRAYNLFSFMNPPGVRFFPVSAKDLFTSWCNIVRAYSALALTFPDDRLAAIGGIAAELQRVTGVRYLAGLWQHERLYSLLQWRVFCTLDELRPRPTSTRAPSWSWPTIDNKVAIHTSVFKVDRFYIVSASATGGFGRVASGLIEMQGPVCSGYWWRGSGEYHVEPSAGLTVLAPENVHITIFPDCCNELFTTVDGKMSMSKIELTSIAIGRAHSNNRIVRGLLLCKIEDVHGKDSLYMRLGMFQVEEKGTFSTDDWDVSRVKVV